MRFGIYCVLVPQSSFASPGVKTKEF